MRKPDEETLHILTEIEKAAIEAMEEAHPMVGARMLSSVRWIRKLAERGLRKGDHAGVPYDEEGPSGELTADSPPPLQWHELANLATLLDECLRLHPCYTGMTAHMLARIWGLEKAEWARKERERAADKSGRPMTATCIVCDLSPIAKTDPEAAIAVALLTCHQGGLDGLKDTMCREHRSGYAKALMRGDRAVEGRGGGR